MRERGRAIETGPELHPLPKSQSGGSLRFAASERAESTQLLFKQNQPDSEQCIRVGDDTRGVKELQMFCFFPLYFPNFPQYSIFII